MKQKQSLSSIFFSLVFFCFLFPFPSLIIFSFSLYFLFLHFGFYFQTKTKKDKGEDKGIPCVMCITNDDATRNGSKCNNVMKKRENA